MKLQWWIAVSALTLAAFGCETENEEAGGGEGGSGGVIGGAGGGELVGGAGGEIGGSGGEIGGAGGEIGGAGGGQIEDCGDATTEAECTDLPECVWDGATCGRPIPPECFELESADQCEGAGCHWWADMCHETPAPVGCDQPRADLCIQAGCEWTPQGCRPEMPACEALPEPACGAREDCRWRNGACEVDPSDLPCPELGLRDCAMTARCLWSEAEEICIDRPEGDCEGLDADACEARRDCVPLYAPPPCACDCAPEDENCECPECDPVYVGCEDHEIPGGDDCEARPAEICEEDPQCVLQNLAPPCDCGPCEPDEDECVCDCPAPVEVCVPREDPQGCFDLDPDLCLRDPRCQLSERVNCGDGELPPPPPDGEPFPDEPCAVELICEPIQNVDECLDLPIEICANTPECEVLAGVNCDPNTGVCQEELICIPSNAPPPPEGCWDYVDADACNADPECQWYGEDFGGGCDCFIDEETGEEICFCEEPFPGGFCDLRFIEPPEICQGLDPAQCEDTPGCAVLAIDADVDCPPGEDCPEPIEQLTCVPVARLCATLSAEDCATDPRCDSEIHLICVDPLPCPDNDPDCLPPGEGGCEEIEACVAAPNPCANLDAEACADQAGCVELQDPDGGFVGCWSEADCGGLEGDLCDAHPSCQFFEEDGGACGCEIDEQGNEICWCEEGFGICVPSDFPPPGGGDCAAILCPEGTACVDGQCIGEPEPPRPGPNPCIVSGCSGEICAEEPMDSLCVWRPEFECLPLSACELQGNGACGWTPNDEYAACLDGIDR